MESHNKGGRVYLDFTQTSESPFNTGIQKVMRKLDECLPLAAREFGAEVIPCICSDGKFFRLGEYKAVVPRSFAEIKQHFSAELSPGYRRFAKLLSANGRIKAVKKQLLPEPGHLGVFNFPIKLGCKLRKRMRPNEPLRPIEFEQTDSMILGECYWGSGRPIFETALEVRKAAGITIQSVIYDLIPMTHSHYFDEHTASHFEAYYRMLIAESDVVTAISETVRNQIRRRIPGEFPEVPSSRIQSFRLGCEIVSKPGKTRECLRTILPSEGRRVHLMVSTFEPRKNHRTVLDAFEKLWEHRPNEELLLAGRIGWGVEDVIDRCHALQRAGKPVYVFHDLTDSEIDYCYRNCSAVIYPSEVEGFGLPIVEGLWHKKKTIVSDTEIHREVGRDDCSYFPPRSSERLLSILMALGVSEKEAIRIPDYKTTTWPESCRELLEVLMAARQAKVHDLSKNQAA